MTTTLKQLGQLRPADANAASLYSPGTGVEALIKTIVVCNTSASPATFRIFHDDNGTTYAEATALAFDHFIDAKATVVFEMFVAMSDVAGNLAVRSSIANALTFTAYGSEQS